MFVAVRLMTPVSIVDKIYRRNVATFPGKMIKTNGKNLVEGYCVMCHDLGRVVATARKSGVWRAYVLNMLERNSMNITETQLNTMVSYLSQHFGK